MLQKITQGLKFFVLLIFALELLTPLFLSASSASDKNYGTHLVNNSTSQNQLFYLFAEELDEETSEGHKELPLQFDFDLVSVHYLQIETTYSSLVYVQHTYECLATQPKLFILNSIFLI